VKNGPTKLGLAAKKADFLFCVLLWDQLKTCKIATLKFHGIPEKWCRFCQKMPVLGAK
jgi:hypothetical protein